MNEKPKYEEKTRCLYCCRDIPTSEIDEHEEFCKYAPHSGSRIDIDD